MVPTSAQTSQGAIRWSSKSQLLSPQGQDAILQLVDRSFMPLSLAPCHLQFSFQTAAFLRLIQRSSIQLRKWSWDETKGISHEHCRVLWSLDYGLLIKTAATAAHSKVHPTFCSLALLQVLVDDEIEKGCMHVKILQEPDSKKLLFSFVAYQRDKQLDEPIENFT